MTAILENISNWFTSDKEFVAPQVPRDDDNFCKSFQLDQEKEIKAFFEEFGFVVIDNILSEVLQVILLQYC
jgi:hypothetical protein